MAVSRVEPAPSAGVAERPVALWGSQAQPGAGVHRTAPDCFSVCGFVARQTLAVK